MAEAGDEPCHTQEGRRGNNLPRLKLVQLQFAPYS